MLTTRTFRDLVTPPTHKPNMKALTATPKRKRDPSPSLAARKGKGKETEKDVGVEASVGVVERFVFICLSRSIY